MLVESELFDRGFVSCGFIKAVIFGLRFKRQVADKNREEKTGGSRAEPR